MESLFQLLMMIFSAFILWILCVALYGPIKKFLDDIYIGFALLSILCGFMGFVLFKQTPVPDAMFVSVLDSFALMEVFGLRISFILLALCPVFLLISISKVRIEGMRQRK